MAKKRTGDFEKKLLQYLRKIGAEDVPVEGDGSVEVMTRVEALARATWKEALGYVTMQVTVDKEGKEHEIPIQHAPDRYAKQIIFDHLLGKPKQQTQKQADERAPKAPPVHDKVDEALVGHLNELAENSHVDSGSSGRKDKATTGNSLSKQLAVLGFTRRPKSAKRQNTKHAVEKGST